MRLEIARGDITHESVDAIVNAANEQLERGGGVCGAIFAAAGPELDASCAARGGCRTGDVAVTPGFRLHARWIIHAVGPVWRGGDADEARLLASCYRRALEVAGRVGARSVAFPAISTGIYGYPFEAATEIAVGTIRRSRAPVDLVRLVCFDEPALSTYEAVLARKGADERDGATGRRGDG